MRICVYVCLLLWILASCRQAKERTDADIQQSISVQFPDTGSINAMDGAQLAQLYCQLCHMFPEPDLLTREHWERSVLPRMGYRLGVNSSLSLYSGLAPEEIQKIAEAEIFPESRKITEEGWQKLVAYYLQEAPEHIPDTVETALSDSLLLFKAEKIRFSHTEPPLVTLVHFDPVSSQWWIGNRQGKTHLLNSSLQVADTLFTESPVVDVVYAAGKYHLLSIGIMDPSDRAMGKLLTLEEEQKQVLLQELQRPVHLAVADVNQDGTEDYVVSSFGHYTGNLSWYDGGNFQKHLLDPHPGAVRTEIHDFNQDGLPDIMALLAQGDERIVVYYNQGEGRFKASTVLRFPPVYGSSDFDLADFNADGRMDILYANGDNADFSIMPKKYHGIRIFENQGNRQFREVFFYPADGATRAEAADFDADGDLDVVLMAHFADFQQAPEKSFIYLENISPKAYNFTAHRVPEADSGRWLTFDTGDMDADGDLDILLGAFVLGQLQVSDSLQRKWMQTAPDVLLLENTRF